MIYLYFLIIIIVIFLSFRVYKIKNDKKNIIKSNKGAVVAEYGIEANGVNLLNTGIIGLINSVKLEDGKSYTIELPNNSYVIVNETLTNESLRKFSGLTRDPNWSFHEIVISGNVLKINWVTKTRSSPLKPTLVNIWR